MAEQKLKNSNITNQVHQNALDENLTAEQRHAAEHMIASYKLTGLRVSWNAPNNSLQFAQDRRVVRIAWPLYTNACWTDIRHLFRAILDSAPAVANHGAPNDWGPEHDEMTDPTRIQQGPKHVEQLKK